MRFRRLFLTILLILTLFFSYPGLADIKDEYTSAGNIDAAIAQAKKENKKVLVYLLADRDLLFGYEYDRILFAYKDFVEALENYVLVRDWATDKYAKSKKYANLQKVLGTPQYLYIALIDPADESKVEHISLLPTQTSSFKPEGDVVRELIRFAKGDAEAVKYEPSPSNADKLNKIQAIYNNLIYLIDSMQDYQVQDKFKEMDAIMPGTLIAGSLKNYYARKKDEEKRIEACKMKQAARDKVVICFDEYTFLREIGNWSRKTIYPVLYWHPYLTKNFINEYGPLELEFIPPEPKEKVTESTIFAAILASLSDEKLEDFKKASADDLKKLYLEKKYEPRGVVLLNMNAPEYLGGVALAAGRTQWVEMFESGSSQEKRTDPAGVEKLRKKLMAQLEKSGFAYKGWSDIDYVTVSANIPYNYEYGIAANGGNYVTDDALARLDNDLRYAFVGRLMYGTGVATYQAMCSMFLKPNETLYFSKYDEKWRHYWPDQVEREMDADTVYHPKATLAKFNEIMESGNEYNFVYINSSGGARNWSTSDGGGTHEHIPFSVPCTVHMTHSGTFGAPFDVDSIAVRWILGGAFCYLGSHSEPYLNAFVPPNTSIENADKGLPLGETYRWTAPNQRWRPWKLAFVGDPMYSIEWDESERTEPGNIDRKHTLDAVYKEFGKAMKKAKNEDKVRIYAQTLALSLLSDKFSEVKKLTKTINKKNLSDEELNPLLTELLGFMLHNLDEKNFNLFELFTYPKKFDKMNNWMFDRLCTRMHPYFAEQESSVFLKFLAGFSELEIPDAQLAFAIRLIKIMAADKDYLEEIESTKEDFVAKILKALKKKSKLAELAEKELQN